MKVKVKMIAEGFNSLKQLSQMKLESKFAYRVGKALNQATSAMGAAEKNRLALFIKYGAKQEDGNYSVLPENLEQFNEAFELLREEEVSMDNLPVITMEDFEGTEIEPSILAGLDGWLLK